MAHSWTVKNVRWYDALQQAYFAPCPTPVICHLSSSPVRCNLQRITSQPEPSVIRLSFSIFHRQYLAIAFHHAPSLSSPANLFDRHPRRHLPALVTCLSRLLLSVSRFSSLATRPYFLASRIPLRVCLLSVTGHLVLSSLESRSLLVVFCVLSFNFPFLVSRLLFSSLVSGLLTLVRR